MLNLISLHEMPNSYLLCWCMQQVAYQTKYEARVSKQSQVSPCQNIESNENLHTNTSSFEDI